MAILMAWAAIAGLVAAAGLDTVGSAVRTVLIAALVATAVVLLLRSAIACAVGLATPLALTLVALSTVLPEYAADVYFAWAAAGHTEGPNAATVLAAMTGASQLLVGLAWPLVIVLSGVGRGGSRMRLRRDHATDLWFLLLAAMYGFTVYLKGFLSVLDTLLLLLLFAAYVWTTWRRHAGTPGSSALGGERRGKGVDRPPLATLAALVCLAVATAGMTVALGHDLGAAADSHGVDRFSVTQRLLPLASKAPVLAILALLAVRFGTHRATTMLLGSQVLLLTVVLGTVPVAYSLHGILLGEGGSLVLDERQRSALLLTSAQSLFLVVVLARGTVSLGTGWCFTVLFLIQAAMSVSLTGVQSTLAQSIPAAAYLSGAAVLVYRDRRGLESLLEMLPVDGRGRWRSKIPVCGTPMDSRTAGPSRPLTRPDSGESYPSAPRA